jgi:4-hydroxyacetophenone monooxygenase
MRSVNDLAHWPALDHDALRDALSEADIPVLLMVLVHLTGEQKWLRAPYLPKRAGRIFAEESGGLAADLQRDVRDAAFRTLSAPSLAARPIDDDLLREMMEVCVGEPVPAEYVAMVAEEIGLRPHPPIPPPDPAKAALTVTIIGAGVSGVCAAIAFGRLGIPYVLIDKNPSVGGTWFENTYPEAGVDTPNHFYSYSFAPSDRWTRYFSKQKDILGYIEGCVERYDVRSHLRLGVNAEEARYDEESQTWTVTVANADGDREELTSNILITAVGQVNTAKLPTIRGLPEFDGPLFHTSSWDHSVDIAGKRVALVGTGASAVQLARSVAADADQLFIFQRSAQWIMPNEDYHRSVSAGKSMLLREVPFYASWYRFTLFWRYSDALHASLRVDPEWPHQERSVNETNERHREYLKRYLVAELEDRPDLLDKAMPTYPPYGKRMVMDNDWFKTLRRDNVELIPEAVSEITASGIRGDGGTNRDVDAIIMATGFHATRMLWPLEIVGRGGVSIHDAWNEDEPRSLLGITTPGFPNLFMLLGPTTALAHGGSVIFHCEAQVNYIAQCLTRMVNEEIGVIEVEEAAADAYTARTDEAHRQLVFSHPGMNNWYKNRSGRVVTVSPYRLVDYWWMTRIPDFSVFRLSKPASARAEPTLGATP